ncbi:MAG: 4Fe-4S dicluster domain-containing protein [Phycisphaerae bacterium]
MRLLTAGFRPLLNPMIGGIYFGPPGWHLPEIPPVTMDQSRDPAPPPADRRQLCDYLAAADLGQTHPPFPSLADLTASVSGRKIKKIIISALSIIPESRIGAICAKINPAEIMAGIDLITGIFSSPTTVLAYERSDHREMRPLLKLARTRCRLLPLVSRYPAAHPAILARIVAGCRNADLLEDGILPVDLLTCLLLGRSLLHGTRCSHRPVQVFLSGVTPRVVWAKIGSPIQDVFSQAGIDPGAMQCIANGLLTGREIDPATAKMDGTLETLALRLRPEPEASVDCIRCGWCVQTCPVAINPAALYAAQCLHDGVAQADPREAMACIDCGLCTYICPSRLPLAACIEDMRNRIEFNLVSVAGDSSV